MKIIEEMKEAVTFIYSHQKSLWLFRKHANSDFVRWGARRVPARSI